MRKKSITVGGRNCSDCGEFKSWSEFSPNRKTSTGYSSRCKVCSAKSTKKYYTPADVKFTKEDKLKIKEINKNIVVKFGFKKYEVKNTAHGFSIFAYTQSGRLVKVKKNFEIPKQFYEYINQKILN